MEKDHSSLTKTCSICGLIKPLAAFLQMSEERGTEYGSVCSDCRKKGADKPRIPESDSSTRSSTGGVIDSKSKMQADMDKRELHDQVEEDYYEEREDAKIEQKQVDTNKEQKIALEKKHRQTFLQHMLGDKKPAGSENRWRDLANSEAAANSKKAISEEAKTKEIDQSAGENLGFGLQEKHKGVAFKEGIAFKQGAAFQAFRTRLGTNSTFGSNKPPDKPAGTISEEIEKSWEPGKKK